MKESGRDTMMIFPAARGKKLVKVADKTWVEVDKNIPDEEVISKYEIGRGMYLRKNKEMDKSGRSRNEIQKMLKDCT